MKSGRFKATFEMLNLIDRCIDRQKRLMAAFPVDTESGPSHRALASLEDALAATQDGMARMQLEVRTRVSAPPQPLGLRKRARPSTRNRQPAQKTAK